MAVDTVTPASVKKVPVREVDPEKGGFFGRSDLNTVDDWRAVSSYIHPGVGEITYDKGDPSVTIGPAKVFRVEQNERFVYYVGKASELSLADATKNYVFFTDNEKYTAKQTDKPEAPAWLLAAVVDTVTPPTPPERTSTLRTRTGPSRRAPPTRRSPGTSCSPMSS